MTNFSNVLSVFYRISDSPTPDKCCPREVCFVNFLSVFRGLPIMVVADNVGPKTLSLIKQSGVPFIETSLGNSGSFLKCLELATQVDTLFSYFSEDDYIYRDHAPQLIVEGLRWSNYVTLYDHPDKYIKERGYGEVGRCLKTETWHWRQTISTCCTFGANVNLLRQDMDVFKKHCQGKTPADHAMWCELSQQKRSLTTAIPGAAFNTHRVCEHSNFDWGNTWASGQIKKVVDAMNQQGRFQHPPESVTFQPLELQKTTSGLPNLAALGKTSTPPQLRGPSLAIPDPMALHQQNINKKKYTLQEGELGVFTPI
jgi:hypothetical protein